MELSYNVKKKAGGTLLVVIFLILVMVGIVWGIVYLYQNYGEGDIRSEIKEQELKNKKLAFLQRTNQYANELEGFKLRQITSSGGTFRTEILDATDTTGSYNNNTIKDIIPSIIQGDLQSFVIKAGRLVYINKTNTLEREWVTENGTIAIE